MLIYSQLQSNLSGLSVKTSYELQGQDYSILTNGRILEEASTFNPNEHKNIKSVKQEKKSKWKVVGVFWRSLSVFCV